MSTISLYDMGTGGVVRDIPPHLLPPEVWSSGNNYRMFDSYAQRSPGYASVFGTPSVAPGFIFHVPAGSDGRFWLYGNLTAVYAYDSGVHTNITRAAGAYTAVAYRDWNACLLGGVPILNNGADVPQYWPTLSAGTDLANLTNWTSTLRAKVIRNFGKYLVALNLTDSGTELLHAIQWSSPADPGSIPASWDYTNAAVDAGRTHLTDIKGGEIVDGILLGNYLIIYKQNSTHIMRYIGGNDVFGFEKLFDAGALGHRCACAFDLGRKHFVASEESLYIHMGTKDIKYPFDEKSRRSIFEELSIDNRLNSFVFEDPATQTVSFCYPVEGNTYPNKRAVWNYQRDVCYFEDFDGLNVDIGTFSESTGDTWSTVTGSWNTITTPYSTLLGGRRLVAASPLSSKLWGLNTDLAFGTNNTTAYLQRLGLSVTGKDRMGKPKADYSKRYLITRIWPKIRGDAQVSVRVGGQEEIDGMVSWTAAKTFIPSQKFLDFEHGTRLPAVEFSQTDDATCKIEGYDLELQPLGQH